MSKSFIIILVVVGIIFIAVCACLSSTVVFLLAGSRFSEQIATGLAFVKDFASIVQSIGTVGAIVGGGIWGYRLYKVNREDQLKATIKHLATSRRIPDGRIFLHIVATLSNTSNVALTIAREQIRVQQILPIPSELEGVIRENNGALQSDNSQILWPRIGYYEFYWTDDPRSSIVIEPKESYSFTYGFVLDKDITVIRISSRFTAKHPLERSWEFITLHDVPSSPKVEETEKSPSGTDKNEDAT